MDNIDGKQARRTGTSSGLGELFDHGIDSLNCTLASLCETAAMGLGPTKTGAFTALIPCLPMFFSTWETYHTHTLYLGAFNGPTEGLILACTAMVISGYYGPQVWQNRIAEFVGYHDILGDLTFRDLWIPVILFAFFTAHLPACVYHVAKARRNADLPLAPVFLEWIPMIIFTGSCAAWLGSPYSIILRDNHLVMFCLAMSFVFGRLTTKIILHHLTRQPFPYWTVSLVPLAGGAIMAWLPHFGYHSITPTMEKSYLYIYFLLAMVQYFVWAVRVINRICAVLDINCLTIKKRKVDTKEVKEFDNSMQSTSNGDVRKTKKEL
jgi:ethanolaminephosphotransferase